MTIDVGVRRWVVATIRIIEATTATEEGSHQSGDDLLEEYGHSDRGPRHSIHGGAGFYHGNHHDEGCIREMDHGDRSHPHKVDEQENGNGHGHREGNPTGSTTVSGCKEQGVGSGEDTHQRHRLHELP